MSFFSNFIWCKTSKICVLAQNIFPYIPVNWFSRNFPKIHHFCPIWGPKTQKYRLNLEFGMMWQKAFIWLLKEITANMVYLIHGSLISIRTTFGDCRELNMGCRPNTALYTPGRPNYGVKMMYHYRQIIGGYMTKKFNLSLFFIGSLLQTLTLKGSTRISRGQKISMPTLWQINSCYFIKSTY